MNGHDNGHSKKNVCSNIKYSRFMCSNCGKRGSNCIFKILKNVLFSRQRREKVAREMRGCGDGKFRVWGLKV